MQILFVFPVSMNEDAHRHTSTIHQSAEESVCMRTNFSIFDVSEQDALLVDRFGLVFLSSALSGAHSRRSLQTFRVPIYP